VQDTGEGIAEENLPRIFDPYFTTRSDHSGLGLSTVHSIISRHGGIVEVTSHPGRGTAVSFLVPASRQALLSVIDHPHAGTAGNQLRVLVMDDEEMVCMSVRRMLESLGCAVSTSSDGEDALGKFREALEQSRPFDAVLLDLIVPRGMGGEEAVRQILKMDPKARVIVASGYSSHPVMSQFRTYGFRAVLQKPFGMNEVKTAFSQIGMNLTR
jgi:CheY-like chemotaxis protein